MAKEKKTEMTLDEFQVKERNPIWEIFNFNSNIPISLYTDSTGVKVPETVYRGIFLSNSSLSSENYLLNAKRSSIDLGLPVGVFLYSNYRARASFSFRHLKEEEEKEFAEVTVPLPKYKHIKMALGTAIRSRRSIRKMSGEPLSLKDLSTILFYAGGVSGEFNCAPKEGFPTTATLGDDYISKVRNAPSGGGLYPVTLFLIIQNVEGLENGLYSYLPLSHELKSIKVLHYKDINELLKIADWGP
jgi:hypothetical protein